jgi:NAD(P)-dependent dehydrogenase (short-subunit alcohol dehydrogenase family)
MTSRYAAAYKHPNGPGDARPTAEQIIQNEGLVGKWADRVIFITGCSSGIGVETAKALSKTGAKMYLTARSLEKAKAALGELSVSPNVRLLKLDLESLDSVRACASEFLAESDRLHLLIANAGVMMTRKELTKDGFELQFGVNHLSHFLLINLLTPALLAASTPSLQSRVVVLSSIGHRFSSVNFENVNFDGNFDAMKAYGQSKTANLWTASEIERRYGSNGLHAFSVHPGAVTTNLGQHMSEEEINAINQDPMLMASYSNPAQGAATSVWAAVSKDLNSLGGRYLENCQISTPHDPVGGIWAPGYGQHAFDMAGAKKLWDVSLKYVSLA